MHQNLLKKSFCIKPPVSYNMRSYLSSPLQGSASNVQNTTTLKGFRQQLSHGQKVWEGCLGDSSSLHNTRHLSAFYWTSTKIETQKRKQKKDTTVTLFSVVPPLPLPNERAFLTCFLSLIHSWRKGSTWWTMLLSIAKYNNLTRLVLLVQIPKRIIWCRSGTDYQKRSGICFWAQFIQQSHHWANVYTSFQCSFQRAKRRDSGPTNGNGCAPAVLTATNHVVREHQARACKGVCEEMVAVR